MQLDAAAHVRPPLRGVVKPPKVTRVLRLTGGIYKRRWTIPSSPGVD